MRRSRTGPRQRRPVSEADSYQRICHDVSKAILAKLEPKGDDRRQFLPNGSAKNIVDEAIVTRLLRALSEGTDHESLSPSYAPVEVQRWLERIETRQLYELLALLLFTECPENAINSFFEELVYIDDADWNKQDASGRRQSAWAQYGTLPLDRQAAIDIFGEDDYVTLKRIQLSQAYFCPILLERNGEVTIDDAERRHFPYLAEKFLGEGSMGKVYMVKVATGHFVNKEDNSSNRTPIDLARKDYQLKEEFRPGRKTPSASYRVRGEKEIIQLLTGIRGHSNIVANRGACINGPVYSLFLELASSDLEEYLNSRPERLTSPEAKADFLNCAAGLASGLVYLHDKIQLPGYERCVCYHLDLKPQNVLVFLSVNESGEETAVWKISDFGEAVLKRANQRVEAVSGPRRWFNRKDAASSFSNTNNRRFDGTYLPPEGRDSQGNMGAHSDVWSLGCIISVLFAFLEKGSRGVKDYQELRLQDRSAQRSDQFYRPAITWTASRLNPKVSDFHEQLVHAAHVRSASEGVAVKRLLDFLEHQVLLVDWTRRKKTTAAMVEDELRAAADFYDPGKTEVSAPNNAASAAFKARVLEYAGRVLPQVHKVAQDDDSAESDRWVIPDNVKVKASFISPCGRIVGFWSNSSVRLYTSDMLGESQSHGQIKSHGEVTRLSQSITFWKSVDVNSDYLVASTNRSTFDCYIFELHDKAWPSIKLEKRYRAFIQLPEIRRVAISSSPQNEWFACVVTNKHDSKFSGALYYARFADVLEVAKTRSSVLGDDLVGQGPDLETSIPWQTIDLISPAADLTVLSISKANIIYTVAIPSSSANESPHNIILHSLDIGRNEFSTIILEVAPLEYSNVSLFTAFAPFRKANACAVVTRENRFHVQYFTPDEDRNDIVQAVRNYRLLELVVDFEDTHIFALGTESANNLVWLLRFRIPESDADRLQIEKVQRLRNIWYNDDCKLSLSKVDNIKHILVSSARGVIYRHNLE